MGAMKDTESQSTYLGCGSVAFFFSNTDNNLKTGRELGTGGSRL
jgi:hypothetical protein